ncbi:putative dolichol-phosphate mannosyltransferase subunit 3 [Taenia solium]|eukprot:TsM_000186900 transcript=TsM_000186900 gene=TsM_000186900
MPLTGTRISYDVETPAMVRAVRWISALVLSVAVWLGALYAPFSRSHVLDLIIFCLPVAVIIFFGLFSFLFIVYGVVTFNDCPGEAEKLKQQIDEARRHLEKVCFQRYRAGKADYLLTDLLIEEGNAM